MIRHASAIAVALCLNASWLCAQSTKFTVSAASADVHKSPSTGGPVIGHAPRGTVLEVTRELGSWVKVAWPAEDGVGYVHVSMGLIARGSTLAPSPPAGFTPEQPAVESARPPAPAARLAPTEPGAPPAPTRTGYVIPTHSVGVGGVMGGPTLGFGATARAWSSKRFGIQFEVSRDALTEAPGQLTSIQFTPSLLYSLRDRVTDYLWIRPYLGGGPSSAAPDVERRSCGRHRFGV